MAFAIGAWRENFPRRRRLCSGTRQHRGWNFDPRLREGRDLRTNFDRACRRASFDPRLHEGGDTPVPSDPSAAEFMRRFYDTAA